MQVEILIAIRELKGDLTPTELQFLEKHNKTTFAFKNTEFIEVKETDE